MLNTIEVTLLYEIFAFIRGMILYKFLSLYQEERMTLNHQKHSPLGKTPYLNLPSNLPLLTVLFSLTAPPLPPPRPQHLSSNFSWRWHSLTHFREFYSVSSYLPCIQDVYRLPNFCSLSYFGCIPEIWYVTFFWVSLYSLGDFWVLIFILTKRVAFLFL